MAGIAYRAPDNIQELIEKFLRLQREKRAAEKQRKDNEEELSQISRSVVALADSLLAEEIERLRETDPDSAHELAVLAGFERPIV
jgi:hypothetical protein